MILTIDGPAGAGKSSVTRQLAKRLRFQYLDTGAMYRAVTWAALQAQVDLSDQAALLTVARSIELELVGDAVYVDGQDVSEFIRAPEVTVRVAAIADAVLVRGYLIEIQRQIATAGNYVCEGRDQGTVAFPDAFCKIFLTASPDQRAERRMQQLAAAGNFMDYDQVVREQTIRDRQDEARPVGGLQKAADAIEVNTDCKTMEQVVEELEQLVRSKIPG